MRLDVAENAPGGEVLARQMLELCGAADIADLLIHATNPKGQPAKAAFENREPQSGVAVQDPAREETGHKPHGSPRMRAQTRQIDVVPHVVIAREIRRRPGKAVMHDGQIVILGRSPDRLEIRMIDRPVVVEEGLHRHSPF